MAKVTFDGVNRIIDVDFGITDLDAQIDLYSDWKEWVLTTGSANAKFLQAFRTVAGDPIGGGKFIAPYFFLLNGWIIRPHDADHELLIEGNLYADPATNPIATASAGGYTVAIILERSIDAITTVVSTSGSGGGLTTEQAQQLQDSYTATGITTSSLEEVITSQSIADGKLDSLLSTSGSGLTPEQAAQLAATYIATGETTSSLVEVIASQSLAADERTIIITSQSLADVDLNAILADTNNIVISQSLADVDFNTIITSQSLASGERSVIITSQSLASSDLNEIIVSQSIADSKINALLSVSGSGLTPDQANWLLKIYEVMGLDPTQPLVVTPVARTVSSSISQSISTSGDEVTVTRTV